MKTTHIALITALLPGFAAQAANIAWISFSSTDNTPDAKAVTAGFTQAPDIGYTDLLTGAGHTVTRILAAEDANMVAAYNNINSFDLVIIGRGVASSQFQQPNEATFWNTTVTAPLMDMSGYTLRNSRLGYTTGTTIPDTAGPITLTVGNTDNPLFAGISFDSNKTMVNPYADIATFMTTLQRGISVNTDPLAGGGTVLASVSAGADPAANGAIIAEWNAGAVMATSPATTLGGHRLVFLSGSREANTVDATTAGIMDLSEDGKTIFLNAVNYMATPVPEPASLSLLGLGAAALVLKKRRA